MRNLTTISIGFVMAMCLLALPTICVAQQKIAFASNRDGNFEIYVMNADGSGQTRLTNDPGYDFQPSFNRDGSKIAFFSTREGSRKIFVMNADGTGLTRLTNNAFDDYDPSFSPDGSKIVFESNRDGNIEIYTMNADGTGQTRLTNDTAPDTKPSFSHDGTKIVFESFRGGNSDIYRIDVDGSNLLQLTTDPSVDGNPSYRPDSSGITFHSSRDGNSEIYDMYPDGQLEVRLTNNPASDSNPSYSRNGNSIAFESHRDGNFEIYAMDTKGTNVTRLTNNPADDLCPSWGGLPVVQTIVPTYGVTPTLTQVTINNTPGNQFDPHVSGDWVAYSSESNHSIRYYNFVTNVDAQIPLGASTSDLLAEIKGSKIVFSRAIPNGGPSLVDVKIMVFDASTPAVAPVELIATLGNNQFDCSIGGNTVAFIDYGTHPNGDMVVYDLATSVLTRLTDDTGPQNYLGGPEVSDDGNVVVWTRERFYPYFEHTEIWQAVKTGSGWHVSYVSTGPEQRLDYDPDTNGTLAVYSSDRNSNYDIFWRPVAGGSEVKLDITGQEFDPNITGGYITFAGRSGFFDSEDIYLYDIAHNRVYQLTNTPGIRDLLSELAVLPNGDLRVVWMSDENLTNEFNIHGMTFRLPTDDTTPPVLNPISNTVVTLPVNSTATSMPVTFPLPTATDDSGSATVTTNPISGSVFPLGTTTVNVTATDGSGNAATGSFTVTVLHNFSGFLQPVDPLPSLNLVNAGQAVPVNFSLRGNKGLNIFASGYPVSSPIACDANEPGSVIEETVSAGGSSLSYNPAADQYTYIWKTDKAWKNTCRMLDVRLKDGSDHFAKFRFK